MTYLIIWLFCGLVSLLLEYKIESDGNKDMPYRITVRSLVVGLLMIVGGPLTILLLIILHGDRLVIWQQNKR